MRTIVALTMNPAIDTSASVDHVIPERKLRCASPRHESGGGGINVSRAIRRLGGASVAMYPLGGPTRELLQHLLEQEGLPLPPIHIEDWTRKISLCGKTQPGSNSKEFYQVEARSWPSRIS